MAALLHALPPQAPSNEDARASQSSAGKANTSTRTSQHALPTKIVDPDNGQALDSLDSDAICLGVASCR